MKVRVLLLGLLLVAVSAACSSSEGADIAGEVWVANSTSSDVRVYDGATSQRVATVAVGKTPQSLEVRPGGDEVWVVNVDGMSISVIDTDTHQVTRTIESDQMVDGPTVVRFSEDGEQAYLVGSGGKLNLIDAERYEITDAKPIGIFTYGLTVLPDGSLRAANRQSGDVSLVAAEGEFQDRYRSGPNSYDVLADHDGEALFVTSRGWNAVSVLDPEDHELAGAIPVGREPAMMALTPDGARLWVANTADSTVSMIDARTFQLLGEGGRSIGDVLSVGDEVGDCDGCVEPVVEEWDDQPVRGVVDRFLPKGVVLEDGGEEHLVPHNVFLGLTGGLRPHGVTITPDGAYALVAFSASDDVFVYDAHTGERRAWLHGCEERPSEQDPGCNPGAVDVEVLPT